MPEPRTLTEAETWAALSDEERAVLRQEVEARRAEAARHEANGGVGKPYRANIAPTPDTPAKHALFERDLIQRSPVEGMFEWSRSGLVLLSAMATGQFDWSAG